MRAVRRHLLAERGLGREQVYTCAVVPAQDYGGTGTLYQCGSRG
jgi:hypothetical protein